MINIKRRFLSLAILVLTVLFFWAPSATVTYAAESLEFDNTSVLDDLQSSKTLSGAGFDITQFPFNENGQLQVINIVEYCYTYRANKRGNFGIYLYVYNPQGLNINTASVLNKAQLADKYGTDGEPLDYNKYNIKLCSASEGAYKNLFYKFKITDRPGADGKMIVERVNSIQRRYDISGIELLTTGKSNATEYLIGLTAICTGYAQGCGPDAAANSTLDCKYSQLETIEPTVRYTNFRTDISRDKYTQNQMNSVYFSVPDKFFELYGGLQRVKAEWYEYMTRPIVVTKNSGFYNAAISKIGTSQSPGNQGLVLDYRYGFAAFDYGSWSYNTANNIWNVDLYGDFFDLLSLPDSVQGNVSNGITSKLGYRADPVLYYLFHRPKIEYTDVYSGKTALGGVSSADLSEWIDDYDKSFKKGMLPTKENISADLFYDYIMPERLYETERGKVQRGYSCVDFDVDLDLFQLLSYNDRGDRTFWQKARDLGLWKAIFGSTGEGKYNDGYYNIPPIYIVTDENMKLSDAELSRSLLINFEDITKFRSDFAAAKAKGEKTVLFRFANTEYFSAMVDICSSPNWISYVDRIENEAYVAVESVFLDFDIIQLTFNKDGVFKVIPAAMSPIDIIPAITTPLTPPGDSGCRNTFDVLLWVLIFVIACIVCWLIAKPIRAISKSAAAHNQKSTTTKKKRKR